MHRLSSFCLVVAVLFSQAVALAQTPPQRVRELTERRSSHAQHFLLSDGSIQAQIYSGPVFYEDRHGNWKQIKTRLNPSTGPHFSFEATENQVQVYLSGKAGGFHRVADGDRWVDFRAINLSDSAPHKQHTSFLTFTNAAPNVDLTCD